MSVRRRASVRAHYNYFRDYDSKTGRYVESDPIGLGSGSNPYFYVDSSPLQFVDPKGLTKFSPIAAVEQAVLRGDLNQLRHLLKEVYYVSRAESEVLIKECTARAIGISEKVAKQMVSRGWTRETIQEAIRTGRPINAVNKATGNPATRYVHPTTGQSVVVDNVTGEVIHVGGPGFSYGVASGDLP